MLDMNMDNFEQQVEGLRKGLAELLDHNGKLSTPQQDRLTEALEELQVTLEEMGVVEEELRQQNDELVVTRAAVEEERQRYHELFEFAPDGYLVTDTNGTIWEANRAAAVLLNVPQKFLVGKPLIVFVAKPQRQSFEAELVRLRKVEGLKDWEVRLSPRNGKSIEANLSVAVVRNWEGGPVTLRWLLRDITSRQRVEEAVLRAQVAEAARVELEKEISERKQTEEQLLHNAFHDALTGLPNRALFMDRLGHAIEYGKRHQDYLFAVLFLDLDRFKMINDTLGHIFGDQLLIGIAGRLASCLRPIDTVARLGGDEFTILLEGLNDIGDAVKVAERIQAELRLPFVLGEQEVFTTVSIGIAMNSSGYERPSDFLRDADIAMYRAKSQGSGQHELFDIDMSTQAATRLQLATELRRAIERQEFRIYYQPIVALDTGFISGFEALVRWQHPRHGLISPTDFLPVAVETGLSILLGQWVLEQACRQIQQWQKQYVNNPPLTISVNLCSRHFAQPELIEQIDQVLQKTNLDALSLKLEITESIIMENSDFATLRLDQLRALGVQLSIDDFGTGYSSLARLHRFSIGGLKIDRSFVSGSSFGECHLEIIETIVTLAQKLGVDVTAEGVETKEQLQKLRDLKCKYGQGYFFAEPLSSQTAEALIVENQQW